MAPDDLVLVASGVAGLTVLSVDVVARRWLIRSIEHHARYAAALGSGTPAAWTRASWETITGDPDADTRALELRTLGGCGAGCANGTSRSCSALPSRPDYGRTADGLVGARAVDFRPEAEAQRAAGPTVRIHVPTVGYEGRPTTDGRVVQLGALSWPREGSLPLMDRTGDRRIDGELIGEVLELERTLVGATPASEGFDIRLSAVIEVWDEHEDDIRRRLPLGIGLEVTFRAGDVDQHDEAAGIRIERGQLACLSLYDRPAFPDAIVPRPL